MRVANFIIVATLTLLCVASPLPPNYESVVRISYVPILEEKQVIHVRPLSVQNKVEAKSRPKPRKGEYNCGRNGEKLCRLEPGVIPKNCNGVCQYPV